MTDRSWPLRPARLAPLSVALPARPAATGSAARAVWPSNFAWVVIPAAVISAVVVVGISLGSAPLATVGAGLALLVAVLAPEVGLAVLATLAPLQPPPSIPAPGL